MSQPVWSLSVDLQTKTATFQSGMADAARSARNAFTDIKQGSEGMSDGVSYNMTEARHGVMLLGEEFGVHMPRALVSFVSQLGPVSAAMEAAFPFLAIIVGATLLLEHLSKLREAGEKLTESQVNFGTATANVLNGLNDKLLQAGIKADELNHNHLAALNKQLELIDHVSMNELAASFEKISKAADDVFKKLEKHWYQFGSGSAGAVGSLERFKDEYDSLLGKKDAAGATKLLDETIAREQKILDLQKQQASSVMESWKGGQKGDYKAEVEATNALKALGAKWDKDAVAAQEVLVKTLHDQYQAQQAIHELARGEKDTAKAETGNKIGADADKAFKVQADAQKGALEEEQKAWEENYRRAVSALQTNEREKIAATKEGSKERLAAIDAAIKEENGKGLQETEFYKSLGVAREQVIRQMGEAEAALRQRAADQTLQLEISTAARTAQASMESAHHQLALHRATAEEVEQAEVNAQKKLLNLELDALDKRIAALDRSDAKELEKIRAFEDRKRELTQQSENTVTKLKDAAEERRAAIVQSAQHKMAEAAARTAAQSIMSGQNMAQAFARMGTSMMETALQNLMQMETVQGKKRFGDARTAAADAYASAGNPILGAIEAGVAFTSVMAFAKGGIVPGVGHMDSVNTVLTPGEAVLPRNLTNLLMSAARSGNAGGGGGDTYHVHVHHSPTINALDSDGMKSVLDKHSDMLADHVKNQIRKMNR